MQAIVDGAARKTEVSTRGGKVINYDPEPLAELLNTVSTLQGTDAAKEKARLFEMSANKITQIREEANAGSVVPFGGSSLYYGQPAEDLIRNSLTKIIDSDTNGVVAALEQSNTGKGLKAYVKSMLDTGNKADQDVIGRQIARLLRGNDLSQDQISYFNQTIPGTDPNDEYYQNAKSLGLYAGAIHAATTSIKGDRATQANTLKNIFSTAAGLLGAKDPISGTLANGLTNQIVDNVVSKMDDEDYAIRDALIELTFPRDAKGNPYIGSGKTHWEASFAATAAKNDN